MAQQTLDFSNVPSREPIPEGVYELTVVSVDDTKNNSKGNPMVVIVFEEVESGKRIFENLSIQPTTMFRVEALLNAFGVEYESKGQFSFDFMDLVGETVKAKVIQDEYEEKVNNKIKSFYA